MQKTNYHKFLTEFLKMLVLVLMGCGSAIIASANSTIGAGLSGISFAFGLSVITIIYAIVHITGRHINPAITINTVVTGRMKPRESIG